MRKRTVTYLLVPTFALLGADIALAEPQGPYVGAAIGYASMDLSAADTQHGLAGAGYPNRSWVDDDTDTGFKIYGGYQFNPYLAAEAAYVNLGEGSIRSDLQTTPPGTVDTKLSVDGFNLGLKAGYPFNDRFSAFAKLGIFFWNADADATASMGFTAASASADDNGSDISYGLGAAYMASDRVGVRLDWDHYNAGGDADSDLISLGVQVHF